MSKRDVDLIIRAKNSASREVDSVTRSLDELEQQQEATGSSAKKMDGLLGELADQLNTLKAVSGQLKSLDNIRTQAERAGAAFSKQAQDLAKAQEEMESLARNQQTAATAANLLQKEVDESSAALKNESRAAKEAKAALAEYQAETKRAAAAQVAAQKAAAAALTRYQERPTPANQGALIERSLQVQESQRAARAAALAEAQLTAAYKNQNSALQQNQSSHSALTKGLKDLQNAEKALTVEIGRLDQAIARQGDEVRQSASAYQEIEQIVSRAESVFQKGAQAQGVYGQSAAQVSQQLTILRARMQELQAAARNTAARTNFGIDPAAIRESNVALRDAMTTIRAATNEATKGSVSLRELGNAVDQVARSGKQLNSLQQAVEKQDGAVTEARRAWAEAQAEVKRLAAALKSAQQPSEALAAAFGSAQGKARAAKDAFQQESTAATALSASLRAAGVSHETLEQAQAELASRVEQNRNALLRGRAALIGYGEAGNSAARGARSAAGGIREVPGAADQASNSLKGLLRQLTGVEDQGRKSLSLFQRFRGQLLSLAAASGGVFAVKEAIDGVVQAQLTLDAVQSRFSVAFEGDQSKVDQAMSFTRELADDLGLSYKTLAQQYSRLAAASLGTNLEGEKTQAIFKSISEAARVLRLTDEEVEGSFKALTDIMSKGTIQAEELKGQLGDRFPGAVQIMAKALGITTQELAKMMEQGQLTSDALVQFAEEIGKRVSPALDEARKSAAAAFERLGNSILDIQAAVARSGFVEELANGAQELSKALADPEIQAGFRKLGEGMADLVRFSVELLPYMDEILEALKVLAAFMVTKFVGGAILDTVRGLQKLQVGFTLLKTSLTGVPAALSAVQAAATAAGGGVAGLSTALGALSLVRYGAYGVIAAEILLIADAAYEAYEAQQQLEKQQAASQARAADATKNLAQKAQEFAKAQAKAQGDLVKAQDEVGLSAEDLVKRTAMIASSYTAAAAGQGKFIVSSEKLIKMTQEEIDAYQELLIARLRVIGEQRTSAMMNPDGEDSLRIIAAVNAEERKILATIQESATLEQSRKAALDKTKLSTEQLAKAAVDAARDAELLNRRLEAVAELNFNNAVLALDKVRNAKIAALTVSGADQNRILAATTQFEEQRLTLIRQYSSKQIDLVNQDVARRKAALDTQKLDDEKRQTELTKIEDDGAKSRIQIVQQEVASVSQAREAALGRYQAALQRVADLDRRIADIRLQGEFQVADIRRTAMTDYAAYQSRAAELAKLNGRIQEEVARGNLEVAEALAQRQLQLAGSLNQEVKDGEKILVSKEQAAQNAIAGTTKANDNLITVLQKRKAAEQAEAEQQKKLYEGLTAALENLNRTLARMSGATEVDIPLTVDEAKAKASLDQTVAEMKAAALTDRVGVPITADTRDYVAKFDSDVLSKDGSQVRVGVFMEDGAYKLKVNEIQNQKIVATAAVEFSGADLQAAIARAKEIVQGDFPRMQLAFDSQATFAQFDSLTTDVKRRLSEQSFTVTAQFEAADQRVKDAIAKYQSTPTENTVNFNPNTTAADQARNAVSQPIIVPVVYQPTGGIPARANGGSIRLPGYANGGTPSGLISGRGTGTSDSILAAVSDKEFIMRSMAVRKYGTGVMNALNAGEINPDRLSSALAGGAGGTGDEVTLNLNLNGQPVGPLSGSRDTVQNLVDALSEVARQVGGSL